MTSPAEPLRVGILVPVADLYHRLWSDIDEAVGHLAHHVADRLRSADLSVFCSHPVSVPPQVEAACGDLGVKGIDLLVVAMAPYCPSGVLAPALRPAACPAVRAAPARVMCLRVQAPAGAGVQVHGEDVAAGVGGEDGAALRIEGGEEVVFREAARRGFDDGPAGAGQEEDSALGRTPGAVGEILAGREPEHGLRGIGPRGEAEEDIPGQRGDSG